MKENQSVAEGQRTDPEKWVVDYGDYLYRYALSRVQDPATAEDLVQETFLAALRAQGGFRGQSSERTWLTGILKHKVIDHIRRKSRERPVNDIEASVDSLDERFDDKGHWRVGPAKWTVNPRKLLEQKEFWKVFYSCLSKLSDRLAQALVLREMDGLSSDEIRKIFNISETNTYVLLHRARMRMRRCLDVNWLEKETVGEK